MNELLGKMVHGRKFTLEGCPGTTHPDHVVLTFDLLIKGGPSDLGTEILQKY